MYEEKVYRRFINPKNLFNYNVILEETDLNISSSILITDLIKKELINIRNIIKNHIRKNHLFLYSHKPLDVIDKSHYIIKRMYETSKLTNVGPMASVAGAVSQYIGNKCSKFCKEIIIENGGDIYYKSHIRRNVNIYAGKSILSNRLNICLENNDILGICTSSGTFGHSYSYGKADAVVVVSNDIILADCLATSAANKIKNSNDIPYVLEYINSYHNIIGGLIIVDDKFGVIGNLKLTIN